MDEVRNITKRSSLKKILEGVIGIFVTLILYGLAEGSFYIYPRNVWLTSVLILAGIFVLLGWYVLLIKVFEHRPVYELNLKKMIPHIGRGFVIGFCYFIALVGIMALLGCYGIDSVRYNGGKLFVFFLFYLLVAVGEEILCRGVIFRLIDEARGFNMALIVSALLFGFMHMWNEGATVWSSIAISIEAGLMLAVSYKLAGTLWLPIGIHWAWNFTQGTILGFAVSGHGDMYSFILPRISGPDILTGGNFGAEASIIAVVLGTAITLWLYMKIRKKQEVVPEEETECLVDENVGDSQYETDTVNP